MFPFFSWYINVIYRFTNFPFLLARTLHKLPPLYIFYLFTPLRYFSFIIISCVLTILISGVYILYILDLRYLLIVSSIGNNSWIVIRILNNNFFVFLLFYIIYSIFLLIIVSILGNLSKINNSHNRFQSLKSVLLFFLLVNMRAIPPVPLFFSKVFIISSLIRSFIHLSVYFLLLVLLVNILIIVSYIQSVIKFIIISFSVSSNYYLY
jgi:formate hydrogenlyase subunit 3/multisubunit Na+/H+ antiporter MnhD subunit